MNKRIHTTLTIGMLAALMAAAGCAHNDGAVGSGNAGATSTVAPATMANGAPLTAAQQQQAKNVPPNFQKQFFGSGAQANTPPSN